MKRLPGRGLARRNDSEFELRLDILNFPAQAGLGTDTLVVYTSFHFGVDGVPDNALGMVPVTGLDFSQFGPIYGSAIVASLCLWMLGR